MSDTENNTAIADTETQAANVANQSDKSQIELAREAGNTWEFEGKEYELFLADRRGGVAVPILEDNEIVAYTSAVFEWDNKETMLAAMDYQSRDETVDDETKRVSIDAVKLNAELFYEIVQSGEFTEIIDGERQETVHLTRKDMLETEEETQSSLITGWLDTIHISPYFPKGESRLARLFKKTQDNIFFVGKIGDKAKPNYVLLFEFTKPSLDVRRELRQKRQPVKTDENGKTVLTYPNTVNFRRKQTENHLVSVRGVSLETIGNPFDTSISEHKAIFKKNFNPIWMVFLADALFAAFDNTGK